MTLFFFFFSSWSYDKSVRIETDSNQFWGKRQLKTWDSYFVISNSCTSPTFGETPKEQCLCSLFSSFVPQQVTCDSAFVEIVSTQIGPTNISYCGLRGFSLKHIFNHGVKSRVPLGEEKGRLKSNLLCSNHRTKAKMWPEKFMYVMGFRRNQAFEATKGLFFHLKLL